MNIMPELHQEMVKYLEHENQTLEMGIGSSCPSCGTTVVNDYSDSVANMTSESIDACYACGLEAQFAYGASRTLYEGDEVPGDVTVQQVMLGLLRKVFIHGKEWREEESELMDVLLMKKQMNKDEFDDLQREVVSLQTQLKRNGVTI